MRNVVINPSGATQDVPCYTWLNEIGFLASANSGAGFTEYTVKTYDTPRTPVFFETVGATYSIFEGKSGVTVDGGLIRVEGGSEGLVAYADPSYKSIPMLRKEVDASKKIAKARLYVTARGIYELYINGARVGEDWFNPGAAQYDKAILYSTYDVTGLMQEGKNVIGAYLASGWWSDQMTFSLSHYNFWGNQQSLLAKIDVTYEDGTKDTIVTDESWQYFGDGPITYAGFFNGEDYDATKEAAVEGWSTPSYDDSAWKSAVVVTPKSQYCNPQIVARTDEPVRAVQVLDAKLDSEPDEHVYVYDMGTNMTGVPEIRFPEGKSGQKITIRYAEIYYPELAEGNPYHYGELTGKLLTENLRAAQCTDTYIMKGTPGGETYRPRFTFHGYQYIEISGFDEPVPEENIKGIVLSSIEDTTAEYVSSNPLSNQLAENIKRSLYGNHVSIPTDCPQRDERMGWTGDAQVFSRTATYFGDMNLMYEGWERTVRDAQSPAGWIPDTIPNIGYGAGAAVAWPAASVIPVWECYKQYGNTRLIEDHLYAMKAFLDAIGNDRMDGTSYLTKGNSLAEHLALISTDYPLCNNIFYAYMLRVFSVMADAVGEH